MRRALFFLSILTLLCVQWIRAQQAGIVHGKGGILLPAAPPVVTVPVVDEYSSGSPAQSVKITDNYRWLEDAQSPATRAYIAAQNAYTQQYLDQLKELPKVREQITNLLRVDFVGTPIRRGDKFFFSKRLAAENQASIYMRRGCTARTSA